MRFYAAAFAVVAMTMPAIGHAVKKSGRPTPTIDAKADPLKNKLRGSHVNRGKVSRRRAQATGNVSRAIALHASESHPTPRPWPGGVGNARVIERVKYGFFTKHEYYILEASGEQFIYIPKLKVASAPYLEIKRAPGEWVYAKNKDGIHFVHVDTAVVNAGPYERIWGGGWGATFGQTQKGIYFIHGDGGSPYNGPFDRLEATRERWWQLTVTPGGPGKPPILRNVAHSRTVYWAKREGQWSLVDSGGDPTELHSNGRMEAPNPPEELARR